MALCKKNCIIALKKVNFSVKKINLIQKLSTHISEKEIPKGSVDILLTETFDAGLLGEHIFETLDHAFKHFLKKQCTILPFRASVYIAPIECQAVQEKTKMIHSL